MSKKSGKTFRLAFVRRKIHTMFESRALKAALLAELNGGQDAALVDQNGGESDTSYKATHSSSGPPSSTE